MSNAVIEFEKMLESVNGLYERTKSAINTRKRIPVHIKGEAREKLEQQFVSASSQAIKSTQSFEQFLQQNEDAINALDWLSKKRVLRIVKKINNRNAEVRKMISRALKEGNDG